MREVRRASYTPKRKGWGYEHQRLAKEVVKVGRCAWWWKGGCRGPLQADHIIPRSMGGQTVRENYQALCRRHNIAKGGRNRL